MSNQLLTIVCILSFMLFLFMGSTQNPNLMTFQEFKLKFNKTYESPEEDQYRKNVFEQNTENIIQSNCQECGINKFSDWSQDEFKSILSLKQSQQQTNATKVFRGYKVQNVQAAKKLKPDYQILQAAPASFDWRDQSVITSIKDQGTCGSCWAFSTTACAQSFAIINKMADNTLDLSEQFLLSCTPRSSCDGGYLDSAMETVINSTGMPSQAVLPYKAKVTSGICSAPKFLSNIAPYYLYQFDLTDQEIIAMLMLGPLNIGLAADSFNNYVPGGESSGLRCGASDPINHAVLLIGYTETVWIIKNQWGVDFGDSGYMYITRDRTDNANCKIGSEVAIFVHSCDIPNCVLCRGVQDSCQICASGYGLNFTSNYIYNCVACSDPNCDICYSYWQGSYSGKCYTCKTGFAIDIGSSTTYSCDEISIANCAQYYVSSSVTYCYTCNSGYVLDSTKKNCLKCTIPHCISCATNSLTKCSKCQTGYIGTSCTMSCNIPNCLTCSAPNTCSSCKTGYNLPNCVMSCNIENCQSCSAPDICGTCKSGFIIDSTKKVCLPCTVSHCNKCVINNGNKCSKCQSGYVGSNCDPNCNIVNCQNCNIPNVCASCKSGFIVSSTSKSCLKCNVARCLTCVVNNGNKCASCSAGYSIPYCISCTPANCLTCSTANVCSGCKSGYTLSTSKTCLKCNVLNCVTCPATNLNQCTTCAKGFTGSTCSVVTGDTMSSSEQAPLQNSEVQSSQQVQTDFSSQNSYQVKSSQEQPGISANNSVNSSILDNVLFVPFIIVLCLFIIAAISLMYLFLRKRKTQQLVQQNQPPIQTNQIQSSENQINKNDQIISQN